MKPDARTPAEVAADLIASDPPSGHALVVDEPHDIVAGALGRHGIQVLRWETRRVEDREAHPWQQAMAVSTVFLRLPPSREFLDFQLHAIAGRLLPGGRLYVFGSNAEGARSAGGSLEGLFGEAETIESRRHCRVWEATRPAHITGLRPALEDWATSFAFTLAGVDYTATTLPGCFAAGRLDGGTRLLLEALLHRPAVGNLLDFGCGVGVIGLVLGRTWPGCRIVGIDNFSPAVEAARQNVPAMEVHLADGWRGAPAGPFDLVVSNPPIHSGKAEDHRVLGELLRGAPGRLRPGGRLVIVVQSRIRLADRLRDVYTDTELLARDGTYEVWSAIAPA